MSLNFLRDAEYTFPWNVTLRNAGNTLLHLDVLLVSNYARMSHFRNYNVMFPVLENKGEMLKKRNVRKALRDNSNKTDSQKNISRKIVVYHFLVFLT